MHAAAYACALGFYGFSVVAVAPCAASQAAPESTKFFYSSFWLEEIQTSIAGSGEEWLRSSSCRNFGPFSLLQLYWLKGLVYVYVFLFLSCNLQLHTLSKSASEVWETLCSRFWEHRGEKSHCISRILLAQH